MDALVVAVAALIALVLIDAGYWIAISLMRWSPVILSGAATAWFASREGLGAIEALATGLVAGLVVRAITRRLRRHTEDFY